MPYGSMSCSRSSSSDDSWTYEREIECEMKRQMYSENKYEDESKDNFHQFFNNLDALRTRKKLCDLVVQVEEQTFFCHKIILAASSEYFNALLGGDFQESKQDQIRLDIASVETFKTILSYIYTRKIHIKNKNATELLIASDYLGMDYVFRLCYEYIEDRYKTIPTENILEVFQFFFNTGELDTRFISLLCKYLAYNCSVLLQSSLFTEISSPVWNSVLGIVDLQQNGDEIVEAIIRWVNYKLDDRKVHLSEMIAIIKFVIADAPYLKVLEKFAADCNPSDVTLSSRKLIPSNSISNLSLHVFFTYVGSFSPHMGIVALDHKLEWKCYSRKNEITYIDGNKMQHITPKYPYNKRCVSGENLYHVQYNDENIPYNRDEKRIYFLRSSLTNMNKRIRLKRPPIIQTPTKLCSVRDQVYLYYHGYECNYNYYPRHPDFTTRLQGNVFLYQSERDTWYPVPVSPVRIQDSMLVSCNNILYMLGSTNEDFVMRVAYRYDSRMQNWEILPSRHYTYERAAACECNGKIYVSSRHSSKAECYDPVANKWTEIARKENMSECDEYTHCRKCYLELASHNDLVWALEKGTDSTSLNVYNPKTNKWSNFKSPIVAIKGSGYNNRHYKYVNSYYQCDDYHIDDFINITLS